GRGDFLSTSSVEDGALERKRQDKLGLLTRGNKGHQLKTIAEESNDGYEAQMYAESMAEGDFHYNAAPRTTAVEYNMFDRRSRYFLYSPSGGLSNQLLEIAYALEISRLLNRTLFVP